MTAGSHVDNYSSTRTTLLVLRGTFVATILLGTFLVIYNVVIHSIWLEESTWVVAMIFIYIFIANFLLKRSHQHTVNYMLIAFYIFIAFCTLLFWGLNAPVGILTISFAVILPSILMGAKSIMPVALLSITALAIVQFLHKNNVVSPNLHSLSIESTFWDVAVYSTILSIFALVSWLAGTQREKNLQRALSAETALRFQKDSLAIELEKESSALRLTQLNQIRHLHKFALLGQSTATTLHELSNHLSVLNLDIDDLSQQLSNSKAIENARDGINHINKMVKQARQQLNSYDQYESFNALTIINRSVKDMDSKFKHNKVKLTKQSLGGKTSFFIKGNPLALMQIITILLNNAVDASKSNSQSKVSLEVKVTKSQMLISIVDNGKGVDPDKIKTLFSPVRSTKEGGLGVGLYIAQHLTKDQFGGLITLSPSEFGASFLVCIPRNRPTKASRGSSLPPSHTPQQPHAPPEVA